MKVQTSKVTIPITIELDEASIKHLEGVHFYDVVFNGN